MTTTQEERLEELSPQLFTQAKVLLEQQPRLRQRLKECLEAKPRTGLYRDEYSCNSNNHHSDSNSDNNNDNDNSQAATLFRSFACHVRRCVSRSPRTVLRQGLNQAVDQHVRPSLAWTELCQTLDLDPTSKSCDIHAVHKKLTTLEQQGGGKVRTKLIHAQRQLQQLNVAKKTKEDEEPPSENQAGDERTKETSKGLSAPSSPPQEKRSAENPQPLENKNNNPQLNQEQRRIELLVQKVEQWQLQLQADVTFQRHQRARALWQESGAAQLWKNFSLVDLDLCRQRGKRGAKFEQDSRDLCFAMIVLQLVASQQLENNKMPLSCFRYETNLHWWLRPRPRPRGQSNNQQPTVHDDDPYVVVRSTNRERQPQQEPRGGRTPVGEIDLVVFCQERIVALCEMKRSAFEIANAFRQHEFKLDPKNQEEEYYIAAAAFPSNHHHTKQTSLPYSTSLYRRSEGDTTATSTTRTNGLAWQRIPALFVATNLPSTTTQDDDDDEEPIGCEPALSNAICNGFRAQHCFVADVSEPYPALREHLWSGRLVEALEYVHKSVPRNNTTPPVSTCDDGTTLDFDQLKSFVEHSLVGKDGDKDGHGRLAESPLACLRRRPEQILVLPLARNNRNKDDTC
ncbi:hypothetical protein ACA910_018532 [Epithemia clementina (nom. ined.)]